MTQVYVLRLDNGKWYVGHSDNVTKRIKQHFSNRGASWTKLHKPLEVFCIVPGGKERENEMTLNFMSMYGRDNVRGGGYAYVKLLPTHPKPSKILEYIPTS